MKLWFSNLNLLIVSSCWSFRPRMLSMILHACCGSPHSYTCQLFLRYKREIFILGVLGFLKTTRSFPKKSEVFRRRPKSAEDVRSLPKSAKGELAPSAFHFKNQHTCPILSTRFQWTKPGVRRSLVEKWNRKFSRVHLSYRKFCHEMKPEV